MGNQKKKRGAQPGNLNSAKSVLPAVRRLLLGRPLTPELQRVVELVEPEEVAIIGDLGGRDNITAMERALLNSLNTCRSIELLVLFEVIEKGAIVATEDGIDLQPAVKALGKFLSESRQILQALGLARRAKQVPDLAAYIAQRDNKDGK